MTDATLVTTIGVYEGAQGKYYVVNGMKYSVCFPLVWAHQHMTFYTADNCEIMTGPVRCENCLHYGSIRGVFVGYCSGCMQCYADMGHWRGCLVSQGIPLEYLDDEALWARYPYASGIPKTKIGDDLDADVTDRGIHRETLTAAMHAENCTILSSGMVCEE